jgi:1,4-dihydroxy-2-naphthoate octaprenyltransferase
MRTGIDLHTQRTPFSGGSGTLPSGGMSVGGALTVGLVGSAVALAAGIWLTMQIGLVLVPFMVVGAILIVFYTPILTRLGIGEIAAGLGLGGLPVVGVALVQGGSIGPAAIAAGIPATLMTFNLLLLNEFPDEEADRQGGRKHLVIAMGRKGAAAVYALAGILTPVSIVLAVIGNVLPTYALAAVLPSLFLVAPVKWALGSPGEPVPIPALGANVGWNLVTNVVLAGALATATLF